MPTRAGIISVHRGREVPGQPVPPISVLQKDIRDTLLYYDIWQYPLTGEELFAFLPHNSIPLAEVRRRLREQGPGEEVLHHEGFYFLKGRGKEVVYRRKAREQHARMMWMMARAAMHVIKRFPFVRGVCVSGDLSKNATGRNSDVDFFIITSPHRLWIARTLLILFKKIFLFDRKKFFCLNTFVTSDHPGLDERNIFLAAEIAHLKPLYNSGLFHEYLQANAWIWEFFPNFDVGLLPGKKPSERPSLLQKVLEFPFALIPADRLDTILLHAMKRVWARRYPEFDDATRDRLFRSTRHESRAYPNNYQDKILALYDEKLKAARPTP